MSVCGIINVPYFYAMIDNIKYIWTVYGNTKCSLYLRYVDNIKYIWSVCDNINVPYIYAMIDNIRYIWSVAIQLYLIFTIDTDR